MTPGHISAMLAVVGTGLSVLVFMSGSPNLETLVVRLNAPSEGTLERIQTAQQKLLDQLDRVCATTDLRPLFEMAPCSTTSITTEHLDNHLLVGPDAVVLVRRHSNQISKAIETFVSEVESIGDQTGVKAASVYRNWNMHRTRETERMLANEHTTWGQLNRAHQQHVSDLRSKIRAIFSRSGLSRGTTHYLTLNGGPSSAGSPGGRSCAPSQTVARQA